MSNVLPKRVLVGHGKLAIHVSPLVLAAAALEAGSVYGELATRAAGLTTAEAETQLAVHGPNVLASDQRPGIGRLLFRSVLNPLVILLGVLATVSFATADARAGTMMVLMIVLSVGLKLYPGGEGRQRRRQAQGDDLGHAQRRFADGVPQEIPLAQLVPGDVVQLAAGDMIPGDVRIVHAKDLFVSQGTLTGESFPVEKHAVETGGATTPPFELSVDRVSRHERRERVGNGGRRRDGEGNLPRWNGAGDVRAARRDGVRSRHLPVHVAACCASWPSWCRSCSSSTGSRRATGRRPSSSPWPSPSV